MINKILSVALIIVAITIFPTIPMANQNIYETGATLHREVELYLDTILDKRNISPEGYIDFINKIYATNQTYEVLIKHEEKKVLPMKASQISITHVTKKIFDEEVPVLNDYKIATGDYITITVIPTSKARIVEYLERALGININQNKVVVSGMVR